MARRVRFARPLLAALAALGFVAAVSLFFGSPEGTDPRTAGESRATDAPPPTSTVEPTSLDRSRVAGDEIGPESSSSSVSNAAPDDARVEVTARVADRSGRFLDYHEICRLLPNRDPFSSHVDFTPARGVCELRRVDPLRGVARAIDFGVTMQRDGSTLLLFDLPAGFAGALLLVTRDVEASRVDYRAGDPDPVFVVDLAALEARFATLAIDLAGEGFERTPFRVRVERAGSVGDAFDGFMESPNGEPLVLRDLPAGRYRIAAHAEGCGIRPVECDLAAGATHEVELAVVEESRIVVRVHLGAERRRAGADAVKLRAPDAFVGPDRIRLPMARVVTEQVEGPGDEAAEVLSLRYVGLPPGPLLLASGADTLDLSLRPGDNGVVDFVLRDTLAVEVEIRGVGDGGSGRVGGVAVITSGEGVAFVPRRVDCLLRPDGSAIARLDLVPGRYRAVFEFDDGARRAGSFEVTLAGGTVVLDR